MGNTGRNLRRSIAALLAVAAASPLAAAPVTATATASVKIIHPLTLTSTGALSFGTITLNGLTANRTVTLSTANVLTCGGTAELICSGATSVPTYNVRGTNQQVVTIIKTATSLSNGAGGTISMTPIGPNSVTLTNSGAPGKDFAIGGSILLTPTTGDGLYTGTVNVQVDYQ